MVVQGRGSGNGLEWGGSEEMDGRDFGETINKQVLGAHLDVVGERVDVEDDFQVFHLCTFYSKGT